MNDETIIRLFEERSEEAIALMEETYGRTLRSMMSNMLADRRDIEEVISDTYLKLWNSIPPKKPKHLLAYAAKVARNGALTAIRQKTRQKRDNRHDVLLLELEGIFASNKDIGERLSEQELTELINRYLATLGREQRVMFLRRYFAMDEIDELARDFDMSRHAVSVKLSRIRKGLKKYLREEGISI